MRLRKAAYAAGWRPDMPLRDDWYGVGSGWRSNWSSRIGIDSTRLTRSWYRWVGTHWEDMPGGEGCPPEIGDALARDPVPAGESMTESDAGHLAKVDPFPRSGFFRNRDRGLVAALRVKWGRPFPDYSTDEQARERRQQQLCVPSGTVDLETGIMVDHDPSTDDHRAVTSGITGPGSTTACGRCCGTTSVPCSTTTP